MDEKSLQILEFFKILEQLSEYTSFAVSAEKALHLRPTADLETARMWQEETAEAAHLLAIQVDLTIGGARDILVAVDLARHGGVLSAADLLDVKYTLISARTLARTFERLQLQYPRLAAIAGRLAPPYGVIDAISRAISERGDILDSASERLRSIRRDLQTANERLLSKMQRLVSDPKNAPYLQEALITQRDGRYVLPLRAEFKGRIRAIVHDQSSSGATLFIEPLSVVDLNNECRELELQERDEVHRILGELSHQVGSQSDIILQTLDAIADLDLVLAKARYAEALAAVQPRLHPLQPTRLPGKEGLGRHPGSVIRLYQARHPLLDQRTVVPIDVELDAQTYAMVITGPNTGGKTVTLKTIGLLALMAQAGLHIPAHSGSELSVFASVFADIGDEQSIEQSLSTFSGHITNIIRILNQADERSLVIIDELGAGTDPQEGAALARALLSFLLQRGVTTLVTTHHPELKTFAHATPGAVNASVEFDLETLRPTFHLTVGLPGRSNALAIARRLGLPDEIIQSAREEISPQELQADNLLNEIYQQRDLARQARSTAEQARQDLEKARQELLTRLDQIEEERRKILEEARNQAETELQKLQEELRSLRRRMTRKGLPVDEIKEIETQAEAVEEAVEKPIEQTILKGMVIASKELRLGDKVKVRSLNSRGVVTWLGEEDVEVQIGGLRVRTRRVDVEAPRLLMDEPPPKENLLRSLLPPSALRPKEKQAADVLTPSPGIELDLRGQRGEDALEALERYLDAAYLAGLPFARIIHGKGTGRLRQVVRQALSKHPHVQSFESGAEKEGGDGVTIARLEPS